jgi:phage shock protein PspC (stress-responsive transcriptional regulator)
MILGRLGRCKRRTVRRRTVKKLYRSHKDKNIAGICGGLGEMFSIDSTLIRLAVVFIAVVLVIINGAVAGMLPLMVAYLVGWMIVPVAPPQEEGREDEGRMKKIYRSEKDKKIAGICGGLGEMFSIDSTVIRLAVVFIGLVTGILPIIIAYIVGWMIIPTALPQQEQEEDQQKFTTT